MTKAEPDPGVVLPARGSRPPLRQVGLWVAVALSVLVVTRAVSGGSPRKCDDLVVAVVRGRRILDSPTQRPRCCKPPTG